MKLVIAIACMLPAACAVMQAATPPKVLEHVLVYREAGRFGGWPANHGIWRWGNEIVVGFSAAYAQKKPADRHQYNSGKPEEPRLARSLDGGRTWSIEAPPSLLPPEQGGAAVRVLREPMDFRHPGFAMTIRFTTTDQGPSRLFYSTDRAKTWAGPYLFPLLGQLGIAARTDYVIDGQRDAFVFLTASKQNGKQGRPLCARTTDGGLSWKLISWIGEEPQDFAIMPSTVRLSKTELLTTVRCKEGSKDWIDAYHSSDNGAVWKFLSRPVPSTGGMGGNPPSLIHLKDGRLALTYGYRGRPYGIRARLSDDRGKTWSSETVLRDDSATWEVGYTRSVERPDGKIVTVYYFAEHADTERVILATIWDPGAR